jgi:hypothetical protein
MNRIGHEKVEGWLLEVALKSTTGLIPSGRKKNFFENAE